tara:strand:+ start:873 stop:1130 length:258 start_codon:yes stop_codon:yes gene_type:complete
MAKEKPTNISKEQLEKLQSILTNINQFNLEIGRIENRKHSIIHQSLVTQEALKKMQDELEEEYGTVNVNVQTGEINYDVEANKKD